MGRKQKSLISKFKNMLARKGGIKTWLVFVLIIVIAFGVLYYFRNIYQRPAEEVAEEEGPTKGFAVVELTEKQKAELDNEAMNSALLTGDLEDCEAILYDEELKQQCLDNLNYSKIIRSGNESQCEQLADPELRQQCYDKIYFNAAMASFDLSLCAKISDEDLKENCTNQIQVVMGRTAGSASECESITDEGLMQECLDNYYYSSSIEDLDAESCNSIADESLRSRCAKTVAQNIEVIEISKQQVAKIPTTTAEILEACSDLASSLAQECKDQANYDLAFEEKDLSYCNQIGDEEDKQECLQEQSENIDQYYLRQAMAMRDESMCNQIANDALQDLCMNSI